MTESSVRTEIILLGIDERANKTDIALLESGENANKTSNPSEFADGTKDHNIDNSE